MSFQPLDYVRHILLEADFLVERAQAIDLDVFLEDGALRRAFVRSIEVMGEATKKLPDGFRARYPEVHWSEMARMRDRLIHGYFDVDYEVVWDVVHNDIPELKEQLEAILTAEAGVDPEP